MALVADGTVPGVDVGPADDVRMDAAVVVGVIGVVVTPPAGAATPVGQLYPTGAGVACAVEYPPALG